MTRFSLVARVSTENPSAVQPVLAELINDGTVTLAGDEFLVEAEMLGESARELNRLLLSALRKVERRTRLRAQWTSGDTTERFFDYVPKGISKSNPKGPA